MSSAGVGGNSLITDGSASPAAPVRAASELRQSLRLIAWQHAADAYATSSSTFGPDVSSVHSGHYDLVALPESSTTFSSSIGQVVSVLESSGVQAQASSRYSGVNSVHVSDSSEPAMLVQQHLEDIIGEYELHGIEAVTAANEQSLRDYEASLQMRPPSEESESVLASVVELEEILLHQQTREETKYPRSVTEAQECGVRMITCQDFGLLGLRELEYCSIPESAQQA